jgi:hypothetical protein
MVKIDWVTLLGGGIIAIPATLLFERLFKRGKLKLDSSSLILHIQSFQATNTIEKILLDLQFVNTSGFDKQITGIKVFYIDGSETIPLEIKDHNVPPASVIEAKKTKCLQFEVFTDFGRLNDPLGSLSFDQLSIEVKYKLNGKDKSLVIPGSEFRILSSQFQITAS